MGGVFAVPLVDVDAVAKVVGDGEGAESFDDSSKSGRDFQVLVGARGARVNVGTGVVHGTAHVAEVEPQQGDSCVGKGVAKVGDDDVLGVFRSTEHEAQLGPLNVCSS